MLVLNIVQQFFILRQNRRKSLKILLNRPKRHDYVVKWLSDEQILVVGFDERGTFKLDINTKQLIELTSTPTP